MKPLEPISIWQPETRAGRQVFVRPEVGPFGDHFSARREIPLAKAARRRICFFGESVAAGYLYAPHLTPAMVLENQLNRLCGAGAYEVVDLARTNEVLAGLAATVRASLQLAPDLLVIFTGNNWNLLETPGVSPYNPNLQQRRTYAEKLAAEGVEGPMVWAASELVAKVDAAFDAIAAAVAATVPILLVIPEVNLADWSSRQPPVRLAGKGNARWFRHYRQALAQIETGSWPDLQQTALNMLALDEGTCPTTYRLLALAHRGHGALAKAQAAARAEIDSCQYANLCFMSAPQINGMGKKLLQRQAARPGFHPVDLSAVFAPATAPLPGRDLFLDYCHLTRRGMNLAMAAVSATTLGQLEGDRRELPELMGDLPEPQVPAEIEAVALFGAALHTAHRLLAVGEGRSLLIHWCEAALQASPGIAATMLDLVEARLSGLPAVMTRAQTRNQRSTYPLSLQQGWRYDHMDFEMIEVIRLVLSRRQPSAGARLETMLLDHVAPHTTLTEEHLWEPLARPYPELMPTRDLERHAGLRAFWPVTEFGFLATATADLMLDCVLRAPVTMGAVAVHIGGVAVGALSASTNWQRHSLRVAAPHLKPGINRIAFHWPDPDPFPANPLREVADRLMQDREISPHPTYGELFSLQLTVL